VCPDADDRSQRTDVVHPPHLPHRAQFGALKNSSAMPSGSRKLTSEP
jgi:hypothetical protein